MFHANEATWDRIVRAVVGVLLLYLGLAGVVAGSLAIVLDVVGAILLVTGLIGWCPLYHLFGLGTRVA